MLWMIGVLSLWIHFSFSLPSFTWKKKKSTFYWKRCHSEQALNGLCVKCKVTIFQSTFHTHTHTNTTHADYRFPKRTKPQQRKSANNFYSLFFHIFIVFLKMQSEKKRRKKLYTKIVFASQTKDWKWDANNNKIEVL